MLKAIPMWMLSAAPQETEIDLARVAALWCTAQIPLQGRTCSSFVRSAVSRCPEAVALCGDSLSCMEPPQPRTPLHGVAHIQWSVPARPRVVLLPISGPLWRLFQLQSSPWCWPRLLVGPALQISFSLYLIKCWSQELYLINSLQV